MAEPQATTLPATPLRAPARTDRRRLPGEPGRSTYLYLAPAFVLYGTFLLFPFLHTAWISLFQWDGLTPGRWVGLSNYGALFSNDEIRGAFVHSAILIVFYSVIPVAIGLLLAAVLSRARVRGLTGFRTILFLPQVIATVVVALMWRWIYAPDGVLNQVLRGMGLRGLARSWLGDFTFALPAVGLVGTWVASGLAMVLFIAGVQKIPASLYDAARIDGAGAWREFRAVTLPGLRGEIAVAITLTVIPALRTFDLIYMTTKGGPGDATLVPAFTVYTRAFQTGQVGSAASIGMALAVLIFAITILVLFISERER